MIYFIEYILLCFVSVKKKNKISVKHNLYSQSDE